MKVTTDKSHYQTHCVLRSCFRCLSLLDSSVEDCAPLQRWWEMIGTSARWFEFVAVQARAVFIGGCNFIVPNLGVLVYCSLAKEPKEDVPERGYASLCIKASGPNSEVVIIPPWRQCPASWTSHPESLPPSSTMLYLHHILTNSYFEQQCDFWRVVPLLWAYKISGFFTLSQLRPQPCSPPSLWPCVLILCSWLIALNAMHLSTSL